MIIETKQLSFSFHTEEVLENISMRAEPNLTIILGPNAAGKSTLINCLSGLLKPQGDILIDGTEIQQWNRQTLANSVAYMPQNNITKSFLSVFETVLLGRLSKLSLLVGDDDLEIVHNILKNFQVDHLASKPIGELSGGQQQIIFIAQALVKEPSILLMDEPTNNLDLARQLELFYLIKDITREKGLTTVMALHDLNLASRFADNLLVLMNGRLYSSGRPEEVITKSMLQEVYGVKANIVYDEDGKPQIFPIRATSISKKQPYALNV